MSGGGSHGQTEGGESRHGLDVTAGRCGFIIEINNWTREQRVPDQVGGFYELGGGGRGWGGKSSKTGTSVCVYVAQHKIKPGLGVDVHVCCVSYPMAGAGLNWFTVH